jgi:hypothetical protein
LYFIKFEGRIKNERIRKSNGTIRKEKLEKGGVFEAFVYSLR